MGLINIDVGGIVKGITDLLGEKLKTPLDPNKQAELEMQLNTLITNAMSQSDAAQGAVNLAEAQSPSFFKSGARPACLWLCVFGLAWATVIKSGIEWVSVLVGHPIVLPAFDTGVLTTLLFGLLGLSAARTVEKIQGVA